jgi:hypothetical protein
MNTKSKTDQLAELEARKQAILAGMQAEPGGDYPDTEPYAQHMQDVTPKQDAQSLAQSRPLDANPYQPHERDGIMTMADYKPDVYAADRSAYPEQDSQKQQIAALQKRLRALQGY